MTLSAELVAVAFGVFNALRLVSYLPQIVAVARDQNGAAAISLSCWSIWVGANASAGLYAWFNVGDTALALVNGFNAICCMTVLALAVQKRALHWRRAIGSSRPRAAGKQAAVECPVEVIEAGLTTLTTINPRRFVKK